MPPAILKFRPSLGNYDFDTTIEDVQYHFDVRWNEYDKAWYFDLADSNGTPIVVGAKVTLGSYIGRYSNHPLFQRGVIAAIDTSGDEMRDPGFDDIGEGQRVEIRYYTIADLVAAGYA